MALHGCCNGAQEAAQAAAQKEVEVKQKALMLQSATQQHLENYKARLLKDR